ncbi:MAG: hypothetical protein MJK14_14315 [Rivularia sp. ALOHA_DT_140]|nr:hypothetical protein [Rivularia sp. ALOHA_DT_140]
MVISQVISTVSPGKASVGAIILLTTRSGEGVVVNSMVVEATLLVSSNSD